MGSRLLGSMSATSDPRCRTADPSPQITVVTGPNFSLDARNRHTDAVATLRTSSSDRRQNSAASRRGPCGDEDVVARGWQWRRREDGVGGDAQAEIQRASARRVPDEEERESIRDRTAAVAEAGREGRHQPLWESTEDYSEKLNIRFKGFM